MAYSFDQIFAADPANPSNVAQNASILIYAPDDATKTPLTITDPSGGALANPITVNANGFGPAFMHETLDRVAWDGGGFSGFFTSYEGMKNEAVAARTAADTAATSAATAESRTVTTATVNGAGRLILTKADTTTIDAGTVLGPTGPTGAAGADGSNVLPTDTAIRDAIENPASASHGAFLNLGNANFDRAERGVFGGRVVFHGTSIMHGDDNLSFVGNNGNSPATHAALLSDGRWKHVGNTSVDGYNSTQLLSVFESAVLPLRPTVVVLDPIPNDASGSFTNATTEANVSEMIRLAATIGAKVVLVNGCPNIGQRANISRLNSWIARYAARHGIPLVDWHSVLVDPATGGIRTADHIGDTVHPTYQARQLLGKALDDKLREVIPPVKLFLFNHKADPADLLAGAGFFSGAVNGSAPAGLTDGWAANQAFTNVTVSAQTVAGIQGKTIRATGAASTPGHSIYKDITTGFSVGDTVELSGIFNMLDNRGGLGMIALINPLGAGDSTLSNNSAFNVTKNLPVKIVNGAWSKELVLPAGTTKLRVILGFSNEGGDDGNYSSEFAQVGVRNLTTQGLLNV